MRSYGFKASCSVVKNGDECTGGMNLHTSDGKVFSTEKTGTDMDEVVIEMLNDLSDNYEAFVEENLIAEQQEYREEYIATLEEENASLKVNNRVLEERVADLMNQVKALESKKDEPAVDSNETKNRRDEFIKYYDNITKRLAEQLKEISI